MTRYRTIRLALLAGSLAAAAAPALAQTAPVVTAVTLEGGVRQSIDRARLMQLAREDVAAQESTILITRGAFDALFQVNPLYQHIENDIQNTGYYDPERVKRGFANGLHRDFKVVADALDAQLKNGRSDLPFCPVDGTYSSYVVTLPGSIFPVPVCRPVSGRLNQPSIDGLTTPNIDNSYLYRQTLDFDPLSNFQLQLLLSQAFRAQIATVATEARQKGAELLETLQEASRAVEVKAGLVAERLGELPVWVYANSAALGASYIKPFRNGDLVQFSLKFDGRAEQFRDKPIDPTFGGTSTPNRFGNRIELSLVQPLKRGRGSDTVRAPERAAAKNVESSRFRLEHSSSDQTLTTADAYFGLMAAQDSLTLLRQSLSTQRQLLDNTIRLSAAANVPVSDVTRARARTSEVESQNETARISIMNAQARLADAMGLPAGQVTTLVASDVFPTTPADFDLETMSREALTRRADLRSLNSQRDTSQILFIAAKAETRPRFDVRLSAGVGQAYYGPTFHSLFDENGVTVSNDLYVKYFSPVGWGRAFKEKWEPIASVSGKIELPFGNHTQLGQLSQATAQLKNSEIRVADLGRSIQNNIPKIAASLVQLRTEWQQAQDAVVQYEATWDAAQRLRTAGSLSLIDTLTTEQQLTDARLNLVQVKRDYALALTRLRRETGTLVNFTLASQATFNLAGLVAVR